MKKNVFSLIVFIFLIIGFTGCSLEKSSVSRLKVVTSSYPGYDFARALTKDMGDVSVKMLLKPGFEMHDFEPTPQDIMNIKNSDIFIYIGGDSDSWIEDIIDDINPKKTKIIKLMDYVDLKSEEIVEGMEVEEDSSEEEEYDEHVWTSPLNDIKIIEKLRDDFSEVDSSSQDIYEANAQEYIKEFQEIDKEYREIITNAKRKEIVFGDRFPLRYFTDEYGLTYYAAFPGCSEQVEANAKTISFLIEKVKADQIPVVFYLELTSGSIAKTIAEETGAKALVFQSAHNISGNDFAAGITIADTMRKNMVVLKEALNE